MKPALTANQAAMLLFIFTTGSSVINIPGPLIGLSHNDAWIALLIAWLCGLLLLVPLVKLAARYPGRSWVQYASTVVGAPAAVIVGVLFLIYQIHTAAAVVLDISLFLNSSLMRETDFWLFIMCIFAAIALTIRVDIGKFAGMFGLLMGTVIAFLLVILAFGIPGYHPNLLLPLFHESWRSIAHGAYFAFGFPFGEIAVFAMILPYVDCGPGSRIGRKLAFALTLSVIALVCVTLATVMTFGPLAESRKYSMFEVARTIEISDVFQRIEAFIGYAMIVASFMKATIVTFAANRTLEDLLRHRQGKLFTFPLALTCAVLALSIDHRGEAGWNYIVTGVHPVWGLVSAVLPVLLVYIVSAFRGKRGKQAST